MFLGSNLAVPLPDEIRVDIYLVPDVPSAPARFIFRS
jgi:hypothetical protein